MKPTNPVEEQSLFIDFCQNRGLVKSSIRLYRIALQKYSDFTKMSLNELIEEAEAEEEDRVRLRNRKVKKYLMDFRSFLDSTDLSKNYKGHIIMLIRSFYNEYQIELPRTYQKKARRDKKEETYEDLPTMDDVKRSLEYSNVTYRAITLLMVSSGMSRAEISSLTFKDLFKAFSLDNDPRTIKELLDKLNELDNLVPIWHIKRIKTGKHYFTFNSPEASLAIFGYLSDIDIKYGVVPLPSNKLFSNITTGIPVSPDSITEVYRRINKKAGFRKVNGRLLVRPHSLRKLFASTLEKNDFPYIATRHILGHSVDKTTGAYFKADPESVRDKYLDVVGQISTSAVKVVVVDRYDEVKDEIEDLKLKQVLYERQIKALSKNKS